MSQIIANPKEQQRFAAYLLEVSGFLRRRRGRFMEVLAEAGAVCRDKKYDIFHQTVAQALGSCEEFERKTADYAGQLDQKARLGTRYLDAAASGSSGTNANATVHVTPEALQSLESALGHFATQTMERSESVVRAVEDRLMSLEKRCSEARDRIAAFEHSAACSDEEDDQDGAAETQREMDEVRNELSRLEGIKTRLENASFAFRLNYQRMRETNLGEIEKARQFLREAAEKLHDYRAAQVGSGAAAGMDAGIAAQRAKQAEQLPGDLEVFRSQQGPLAMEAKTREYQSRLENHPELAAISVEEYLAVNRYSQHDFAEINSALRSGDPGQLEIWGSEIRFAGAGLAKLPVYEGSVFRGGNDGNFADRYVPGRVVNEPGFTSASSNPNLSFPGSLQFVIYSKTGRDIAGCSAMQTKEGEVLFAPNTRFEVLARSRLGERDFIIMREV